MTPQKKEEYRYKFAGLAMQAILHATMRESKLDALSMLDKNASEGTAAIAVMYADALIKQLEREEQ